MSQATSPEGDAEDCRNLGARRHIWELSCVIDFRRGAKAFLCVGAHHLGRRLKSLGHDVRLMAAKYVRPFCRKQKNDFNDAEAIAEAVTRPTTRYVALKTPGCRLCTTSRRPGGRVA